MILPSYDDYLDDHHPPCRGGCGQLADECMCNWSCPTIDSDVVHRVVYLDEEPPTTTLGEMKKGRETDGTEDR